MKLPKVLPENFLIDIRGLTNVQKIKVFSKLHLKYNYKIIIEETNIHKCIIKYSNFYIDNDRYFIIRSPGLSRLSEEPWHDMKDYPVFKGKIIINKIQNKLK